MTLKKLILRKREEREKKRAKFEKEKAAVKNSAQGEPGFVYVSPNFDGILWPKKE